MWRVMWLFIVPHVTCRYKKKKTFPLRDNFMWWIALFFFLNRHANIFPIRSFKVNGNKLTVCFVLFIHKKKPHGDGVKWQTGTKIWLDETRNDPRRRCVIHLLRQNRKIKNQRHYLAIIRALTLMKHPHPTQHCCFILFFFFFFLFPFTHNTWLMI